jgi:hypothetical protein
MIALPSSATSREGQGSPPDPHQGCGEGMRLHRHGEGSPALRRGKSGNELRIAVAQRPARHERFPNPVQRGRDRPQAREIFVRFLDSRERRCASPILQREVRSQWVERRPKMGIAADKLDEQLELAAEQRMGRAVVETERKRIDPLQLLEGHGRPAGAALMVRRGFPEE